MSDYNKGSLNEPCLRLPYGFGEEVASVELGDGTGYVRLSDYEELKAENTKLRELVAQLIHCARVGKENVPHYQPTRDGCGFDCVANGEHCSFAKICDHARAV